jgi:hypothetical protein
MVVASITLQEDLDQLAQERARLIREEKDIGDLDERIRLILAELKRIRYEGYE